jgi:hypothetical protein
MKRASYRKAIEFIALNDSGGDDNALVAEDVQFLVTAIMVAEIFDVTSEKVGKDIVACRKKNGWTES